MHEFIKDADNLIMKGHIIKDDKSALICRVLWNKQDLVIKRYNHRGLWHSLRHTIKGSRAKRNWLCAHHLISLEIATPEPLAYWDEYKGPLLWQSFYIAKFVHGSQVYTILHDRTIPEEQKRQINEKVFNLLATMAQHDISHGDMKHVNILYYKGSVVLTDLDGMRVGGIRWLQQRRCRRDVDRYLRDLDLADLNMNFALPQGTK